MTAALDTADWELFARQFWNKAPVVMPGWPADPGRPAGPPPVDARRAYDVVVTASEPFRAGTRFRALPDVRFLTDEGQIRAPGDLLPGPGDRGVDQYVKRLGAGGILLSAEQPLLLDFTLWSQVRDLISPLWDQVGYPVLPVIAELAIGKGSVDAGGMSREATHASLTWVLWGGMEIRSRSSDPMRAADANPPGDTLRGRTGDLLYWPAHYRHAIDYGEGCLALRLRIPADRRLPAAAVKDLLSDRLQAGRDGNDDVPYLAFPPEPGPDGASPQMEPLAAIGDALTGEGPELDRLLRIGWARRVSAAGLEPVPGPREPGTFRHDQRVRSTARIIRMTDEPGSSIWAVNGHAFTVRGPLADTLPGRLASPVPVGELAGEGSGVLALLRKLHELRGIEVVED
ncbi:MAG: hypothetical protein J2P25_17955 [Nocardiopsaceae bacterium]|nr:hypothetical protein [Nocardiopsaceae bacterium]